MEAKLIYSNLLYTASIGVFNNVKNNYDKFKKHIIIVPDKYTLIGEKLLLDVLETNASFKAEVLSLNRLCYKTLGVEDVLDKQGGVILVQNLLYKNNNKLVTFKDMYKKVGFADKLYSTLMQIKSSGVMPENLGSNDVTESLLQAKINDLKIIYECYENEVNKGNYDGLYKLKELNTYIKANKIFDNCAFYFAFFDFLTNKEWEIVETLITSNHYVCMGATYGNGELNEHIYTNEVYSRFSNILNRYNLKDVKCENEILPTYFEKLKKELFAFSPNFDELKDETILIYSANGQNSEIGNIAKIIKDEISKGAKYNQIQIAVGGLDKYKQVIENIFNEYQIPYFIDSAVNLQNTEIGRFISSAINGFSFGFMEEDLKALIFNYYFLNDNDKKEQLYKLIYLLKPNGTKWLLKEYKGFEDLKELQLLVYEKLNFIENVFSNAKTGLDYTNAIKEICEYFDIINLTNVLASKVLNDLKANKTTLKATEKLYELLSQIEKFSGNTEFDSNSFAKILISGLDAVKISLVPLSVDSVFVGDINNSSFDRKNIMLLCGLNLGVAPLISYDLGIVTDNDIDVLKSKYLIEPKISQINMRARQKLFEICMLANKKIIFSYLIADDSGNEYKPSTLINSIKKMFYLVGKDGKKSSLTDIGVTDDLSVYNKTINESISGKSKYAHMHELSYAHLISRFLANYDNCYKVMFQDKESENFIKSLIISSKNEKNIEFLSNLAENIEKPKQNIKNADLIYFNKNASATQFTEYFQCPYMHFLKRGIKLKVDLPLTLDKLDVGNILHRVCELFVGQIKNENNLKLINLNDLKQNVINCINEEFKDIFEIQDNTYIINGLLTEANNLMTNLYNFANDSTFKPKELEFKFKPLSIKNDKKNIKLEGFVDRIDVNGNQFVVFDYKTGNVSLAYNEIYYGLKLQLILYAIAYSKQTNKQVVGVGYYPINDKYLQDKDKKDKNKIIGYFESNAEVLEEMDNTLKKCVDDKKCSEYYDFDYEIKKNDIKYSTNLISRESFAQICNYVMKLIEKATENILNGSIMVSPFSVSNKSACTYCKFAGICKNELHYTMRNLPAKKLEDITGDNKI